MLKKFDWSLRSIFKALGVALGGLLGLVLIITVISFSYRTVNRLAVNLGSGEISYLYDGDQSAGFRGEEATDAFYGTAKSMAPGMMPPAEPGFSTGNMAEEYEVMTYDGNIKSKNLDQTCGSIEALKEKVYVIFENSNRDDFYCSYRFKVEKNQAEAVLSVIKDLKPENLNTNITSIKRSVEGVETEIEILTKKLASIDETLTNAQTAYDEISELATQQQNADALAKIIDSKLNLIERLTNERLNIKSQIDYYSKNKSDQLDQLSYTFFNIYVTKDVIWDWKEIKENWKYEARVLIENLNTALQVASLKLLAYLVYALLAIVYIFIAVFLLKFVWRGVNRIWKSGRK